MISFLPSSHHPTLPFNYYTFGCWLFLQSCSLARLASRGSHYCPICFCCGACTLVASWPRAFLRRSHSRACARDRLCHHRTARLDLTRLGFGACCQSSSCFQRLRGMLSQNLRFPQTERDRGKRRRRRERGGNWYNLSEILWFRALHISPLFVRQGVDVRLGFSVRKCVSFAASQFALEWLLDHPPMLT